jgi:nitrogen fixation/metabolism regulation signal transduction histidine kinase
MIEHVPVPLLSIHSNEQITLWNNAARRLFGATIVAHLEDLKKFGGDVPRRILGLKPGERILLTLHLDNREQRFSVASSELLMGSDSQRLVSLQNIQSELDITQLQAWQDLVRVLTHEIMNSITPVSSLAKTAADLVEDVRDKLSNNPEIVAELNDVKDAVDTVARRSDGLMEFVSSYRRLTKLPALKPTRFPISELFADVQRMSQATPDTQLAIHTNVDPQTLDLYADRQTIEQVLINLVQNARFAIEEVTGGKIELKARLNLQGHVTIEVLDNGPGIPPDTAERIFVPFFTTRKEGSGVGLALSRQIMIANGGSITFSNRKSGGAKFALTF